MSLPSSLALSSISGEISASPLNNDNSAIQTAVNALIAALGGGGGPVITSGYEYSYDEFTANVTGITATTRGTAITIKTSSSYTFDGTATWVEFFSPFVTNDGAGHFTFFELFEDAVDIGQIGVTMSPANNGGGAVLLKRKVTPSAGAHTFTIKAFVSSGTSAVDAGDSTSGASVPGYIRVTKA